MLEFAWLYSLSMLGTPREQQYYLFRACKNPSKALYRALAPIYSIRLLHTARTKLDTSGKDQCLEMSENFEPFAACRLDVLGFRASGFVRV